MSPHSDYRQIAGGACHLYISPELMVLAIGSASIAWAPPSDVSFWMTKEYFNLTIGQTVKTVCFMYTLVAIYGILGVLALNMFVG